MVLVVLELKLKEVLLLMVKRIFPCGSKKRDNGIVGEAGPVQRDGSPARAANYSRRPFHIKREHKAHDSVGTQLDGLTCERGTQSMRKAVKGELAKLASSASGNEARRPRERHIRTTSTSTSSSASTSCTSPSSRASILGIRDHEKLVDKAQIRLVRVQP